MEKKKTSRGTSQDRSKVAAGQEYEVQYASKKSGTSTARVKKAVKTAGNSRAKVENELSRKKSVK